MPRAMQRFWLGAAVLGVLIAVLAELKAQPAPGDDALVLSADETLAAEVSGPDLEIGVNGDYISDFLAAVDTEKAVLSYNKATMAIQLAPAGEEGGDYRCVVMPMRI